MHRGSSRRGGSEGAHEAQVNAAGPPTLTLKGACMLWLCFVVVFSITLIIYMISLLMNLTTLVHHPVKL